MIDASCEARDILRKADVNFVPVRESCTVVRVSDSVDKFFDSVKYDPQEC